MNNLEFPQPNKSPQKDPETGGIPEKKEEISNTQLENIKEVFKLNPELAEITTPEQYEKYLETIFPDSKVKDIVWHGTKGDWYKTEKFDLNLSGTGSGNNENTDGIYFIKYKTATGCFGDIAFPALINIKNPNILPLTKFNKTWRNKEEYLKLKSGDGIVAEQEKSPEQYYEEALEGYNEAQKDEDEMTRSFFRKPDSPKDFHEEQLSTTYVVFNPDQIHILGSKADIEQFKNWVEKQKHEEK